MYVAINSDCLRKKMTYLYLLWEKIGIKIKKRHPPPWGWNLSISCPISKLIDVFFLHHWSWMHRDWRGSNPQLPPWQGGALTNWTTIPGKWNKVDTNIHIFVWFHSNLPYLVFSYFDFTTRCNREGGIYMIPRRLYTFVISNNGRDF